MDTALALFSHPSQTLMVFLPTLLVVPLLLFRREAREAVKTYTLLAFLVELVVGGWYLLTRLGSDGSFDTYREVGVGGHPIAWISRWGIHYQLVIDGISMPIVALTLILMPLVVLGSWKGIDRHWKGYAASLL